jgi:hypothetical protein
MIELPAYGAASPRISRPEPPDLILGWGALDEGKNQAPDGRFDSRRALAEKFYWRPVAPT